MSGVSQEAVSYRKGAVDAPLPDETIGVNLARIVSLFPDREALADFDVPMYDVQSYSEVIHADYGQQNLLASLTWLFGALGLVLAAVGLYGVTSYGVEQRTREIGVRVALGADRGRVLATVLRDAVWPVGIGLAIGIPALMSDFKFARVTRVNRSARC